MDLPVTQPLPAAPATVDIWLSRPEQVTEAAAATQETMLDADERRREAAFVFARDRRIHRLAHALARTALSHYHPVPPAAWTFATNAHGRPEIAGPAAAPRLSFNLSTTATLVACAVSPLPGAVGLDVEPRREIRDLRGVAEHVYTPAEIDAMRLLPESAAVNRFFLLWTLKESYMKARGMGFSLEPRSFSFRVTPVPGEPARLTFTPPAGAGPALFRAWTDRAGNAIALCLVPPPDAAPVIRAFAVLPGLETAAEMHYNDLSCQALH